MFGPLTVLYKDFVHCGIRHCQKEDGSVTQDQHAYVDQLHVLRFSHDFDKLDDSTDLDEAHAGVFATLLGSLSWLVGTRHDIAVYVCSLQRVAKKPLKLHLVKANKLVKWVKRTKYEILYKPLKGKFRVVAVSDAAFRKEDATGLSIRGTFIFLSTILDGSPGGDIHCLEAFSKKQRRVVRSTFGAEVNAQIDAHDVARLISMGLQQLFLENAISSSILQIEERGPYRFPVECVTDCRSLSDGLSQKELRLPTEMPLVFPLHVLKEGFDMDELGRLLALWWCCTEDMVADGLTKGTCARKPIIEVLRLGHWKVGLACSRYSRSSGVQTFGLEVS